LGVSLDDWPLAALRSDVLAPAPVFAPDSDLMPVSELVRLSGVACVLPVWAAASWLKDTASRPEKSAGRNLRIEVS
jgi:hypothetical protein